MLLQEQCASRFDHEGPGDELEDDLIEMQT